MVSAVQVGNPFFTAVLILRRNGEAFSLASAEMNPIPPPSLPRSKLILKGRRPPSTILSFFDSASYAAAAASAASAGAWRGQYLLRPSVCPPSGGRVIECPRTKEGYGNHEFNKGTAENLYNSLSLPLSLSLPHLPPHRVEVDGRRDGSNGHATACCSTLEGEM